MADVLAVIIMAGVASLLMFLAGKPLTKDRRGGRIFPRAQASGRAGAVAPTSTNRPHVLTPAAVLHGRCHVVDGDTIMIRGTPIRLGGIDAPELDQPYGHKAKWALVELCKGAAIRAEVIECDHYGRVVARCFLPDGRDLGAEMVRTGYAVDWPKYSAGRYRHLEVPGVRKRLWRCDARQKGRMVV